MLTPEKIKGKEFQTTGRGSYRTDEVDGFIAEVSSSYEQMFKENGELIKKISILANKVEEYRKDEDSLRNALLAAQKLADQIVKDAKDSIDGKVEAASVTAQEIIDNANRSAIELKAKAKNDADDILVSAKKEAEEILGAVNRKVTHESLVFDMLQKEATDFRCKLINMYKDHLNLINNLPEIAEGKLEKEMPKKEAVEEEADESVAEELAFDEELTEDIEEEILEEAEEAEFELSEELAEEIAEEVDEKVAEAESFQEFSIGDISDDDDEEFEDISSSYEDEDEGVFKLALDEIDFEEENASRVNAYASVDDMSEDFDDDDDEPVSFKSFFKKK